MIGDPDILSPYNATLEDNGQPNVNNPRVQELAYFENLAATAVQDANMNHTAPSSAVPSPNYSAYLKWISGMAGQDASDKSVGPAIGLKVESGDKIDIETWAKFKNKASYGRSGIVGAMASILGNSFVGTQSGLDVVANATQIFQNGLTYAVGLAGNGNDPNTAPYAYVYYLLYDRSFNFITAGWKRVSSAAGFDPGMEAFSTHEKLTIPTVNITEPGYIYIFVANESENTEVWFDDLKITHERSIVVAGADYYPFGLPMENREVTREDYRFGYQGQFSEEDETTGWNEFELRSYEPRLGAWISPDPYKQFNSPYVGMGNAPHIGVDPDGGFWGMGPIASGAVIGAGLGFVTGGLYGLANDKDNWGWYALSGAGAGAALGVLGGAIYKASTYEIPGLGRIVKNPKYPVGTYTLSKNFELFKYLNETQELVVREYVRRWKFKRNVKKVSFEFDSDASDYAFNLSRNGENLSSYEFMVGGDNPTRDYKNTGVFEVHSEATFPPGEFNPPGIEQDDPRFRFNERAKSGNVNLRVKVKLNLNQKMGIRPVKYIFCA